MSDRCEICVNWLEKTNQVGICRYAPPRAELVPVQDRLTGQAGMNVVAFRPETRFDDWCSKGVFKDVFLDLDKPA